MRWDTQRRRPCPDTLASLPTNTRLACPPPCHPLQLAEQRARDEAEEAEKSGKVELRATLKPKIDAWAAGKKASGMLYWVLLGRGLGRAGFQVWLGSMRRACARREMLSCLLTATADRSFPHAPAPAPLRRTTSARCWPACTRCCGRAPAGRRPAWPTWWRTQRWAEGSGRLCRGVGGGALDAEMGGATKHAGDMLLCLGTCWGHAVVPGDVPGTCRGSQPAGDGCRACNADPHSLRSTQRASPSPSCCRSSACT